MKKKLLSICLALVICLSVCMIPAQAESVSGGAVTTAALNLRTGAGTGNRILLTIPNGASVVVKSNENGWCKVVYNGTEGYASAQYLSMKSSVSANLGKGTVTGDLVRVRSGAGVNYSVLGQCNKGTQLEVTGVSGSWYQVKYSGKTAYISAAYVKLAADSTTANSSADTNSAAASNTTATTATATGMTASIIGSSVRMRSGASTSSSIMGTYANGTKMTVTGSVNGWYKVSYNGASGYVSASYMRVNPATTYSPAKNATVSGDQVRLRMGPGTAFASLGYINKNTAITVSGEYDGWYEVYANGKYGYMSKSYIKLSGTDANTTASTTVKTDTASNTSNAGTTAAKTEAVTGIGIITGSSVRMRGGPGTNYAVLGYYSQGTQMTVTGKTGNWYCVVYKGLTGYVSADYMRISSSDAQTSQIVATAKEYLGTKYVWGGNTPSGFDCSGFMCYVFKQYGYSLSRVAADMYKNNGTYVEKSQLKAGDLIFFSNSSNSTSISHVGMYIGDGMFIHCASGRGCVVITAFEGSEYYQSHYVGAKRIIA